MNIKEKLSTFFNSISPGQIPLYVMHKPLTGKPFKECFSIVPEHIFRHGGKQVFGWAIHEIPKMWLEAEFHVIWQSPNEDWIDITPRLYVPDSIYFLPDPKRQYEGIQVEPIFLPLSDNDLVKRYIALAHDYFVETNKGYLAYKAYYIRTQRIINLENEMHKINIKIDNIIRKA